MYFPIPVFQQTTLLKVPNLIGGDTNYSSFIKKVLHFKDKEVHNKIILFTDGQPTDRVEALDRKMQGIYKNFTEISETCGGNQIILKINELIRIVSIECYDRYMGMLTLATREQTEAICNESPRDAEKRVKKWNFKKL